MIALVDTQMLAFTHLGREVFSKAHSIFWANALDVRNKSTQAPAVPFLVSLGNQITFQLVYSSSRTVTNLLRRTNYAISEPRPS